MKEATVRICVGIGLLVVATCAQAGVPTPLTTERVASGLNRPVYVTHAPNDFDRLFIIEQPGYIRILDLTTNTLLATPFLDIDAIVTGGTSSFSEQGLLGLAFHPNYQSNGFFYVNYTAVAGSGDTVIARYTVSGDPNVADAGSAVTILTFNQTATNHNGGWIEFGPNDGYLYIATGDGGSSCDPNQQAQDITNQLLGKILRIDVDGGSPYAIPPSNPFVGLTGDDEIWAYGLRNPWRDSFDRLTGDLYIADVGQAAWEEINFQSASSTGGENYGWDCMEGAHCSTDSGCAPSGCTCGAGGLVLPIHEYDHPTGFAITGGYVYRGCAIPDLQGTYFFADYSTELIWSFHYDGATLTGFQNRTTELAPGGGLNIDDISSFGEDAAGEIYIVDRASSTNNSGEIFRIIPNTAGPANDCNSNGVEDACDILTGTSQDANTNAIPDDCGVVVSAVSLRDHGGTELGLDLLASPVESRLGGVLKLEVGFSEPVGAVSASASCVNNVYGGTITPTANGNSVTLDFSVAPADEDCCTISLQGDVQAQVEVRPLQGDINRDSAVTTGDASIIKPHFNGDPAIAGAEFDHNTDGTISTSDFSQVKPLFNHAAPACP